jgi:hypothetical protein
VGGLLGRDGGGGGGGSDRHDASDV